MPNHHYAAIMRTKSARYAHLSLLICELFKLACEHRSGCMTHASGTGSSILHARPQVMNLTDNRPRTMLQCIRPGGGIDVRKFAAYQQRQSDETLARLRGAADRIDEAAEVLPPSKRSKRKRS